MIQQSVLPHSSTTRPFVLSSTGIFLSTYMHARNSTIYNPVDMNQPRIYMTDTQVWRVIKTKYLASVPIESRRGSWRLLVSVLVGVVLERI